MVSSSLFAEYTACDVAKTLHHPDY